jgi:leucyl-tRNA synthetase
MTEHEEATFDFAKIQEKWLPMWDELEPFRSDDP